MKKFKTIHLASSKNEVQNSFIDFFLTGAKNDEVVMEYCTPQVNKLETRQNLYENCLQNHKFSFLTPDLSNSDLRRDKQWTATNYILIAEMESIDPVKKYAAEVVKKIFDSFGKIRKMDYGEQSGAMESLCADLLNNHSAELETLGLTSKIQELQASNNDFKRLYQERTVQMAEHVNGETRQAKLAVIDSYKELVMAIEYNAMTHPASDFTQIFAYGNRLIDQYRKMIGRPGSSSSSSGSTDDTEEELEEEEEFEEELEEEETEESEETETGGESSEGGSTGSGSNQDWDV